MRKGPLNLDEVKEVDWVRLAAFIDGEGSILLNRFGGRKKNQKRMWIRVTVVNTDLRMLEWIANMFGGNISGHGARSSQKHRKTYYWGVSCTQAAQILEGCMPYFLVKREQAEIVLMFQDTVRGPGHPVTQELQDRREEMRRRLHDMKADNGRFDGSRHEVPIPERTGPKPKDSMEGDRKSLIQ